MRPAILLCFTLIIAFMAQINCAFQRGTVESSPEGVRKIPPSIRNAPMTSETEKFIPTIKKSDGDRDPSDYKVICYLESWAIYRPGSNAFSPADVDPFACTHVLFSFLGLNKTDLTVTILDYDYEVTEGGYQAAIDLKKINPDLKVMIALGGWGDGSKQYSEMVSRKETRTKFIESVVTFLNKYKFDGMDLDWEYPGSADRDGIPSDKQNFALLVEEMSKVFRPRNWLLSAAVPPSIDRIDDGYDVPRLSKAFDFINVMTYDMHGEWENYVDHHAPFKARPFDVGNTLNLHCDGALSLWINKGADPKKIIFGIPFYSKSFTLANPDDNQPRAPSSGPGIDIAPYYELCASLKAGGWDERIDEGGSPYAVKGDQWVGYDTVESIRAKMEYVKERGLGGAMMWAIGLDDFNGVCGLKWPLLTAINEGLGRRSPLSCTSSGFVADPNDCTTFYRCDAGVQKLKFTCPIGMHFDQSKSVCDWPHLADCAAKNKPASEVEKNSIIRKREAKPFFSGAVESRPLLDDEIQQRNRKLDDRFTSGHYNAHSYSNKHKQFAIAHSYSDKHKQLAYIEPIVKSAPIVAKQESTDYKVICYLESWAIHRPEPMDFSSANIDPYGCTHVIFSFLGLNQTDFTVSILDYNYEVIRGGYKAALGLRRLNPNLKVMIAIGGWGDGGKQYSEMVSSEETRTTFIKSVIKFMSKYKFDGLDLDWEYPGATDRDGKWSDKENFALLVEEMSEAFRPRNWLLSAAVPAATFRINDGYDVPRLSKALDFINVMTYDMHGVWDDYVDHHAPIKQRPFDQGPTKNLHCDGTLSYWISLGAAPNKIIFGIPFYGRNFKLADHNNNLPRAASAGAGDAGVFTKEPGYLAYFEICVTLKEGGWDERVDESGSPYAVKGDQWVGYDTVDSIKVKMEYLKDHGLGGAMVWAIGLDDYRGDCGPKWPLLNAINEGLGRKDLSTTTDAVPSSPDSPTPTVTESTTSETTPSTAATTPSSSTEAATPTPTPVDSGTTTESLGPFVCQSDGFAVDPYNCNTFYRCDGKRQYAFSCPVGLDFDEKLSTCNWPHLAKCASKKKPSGISISTGLTKEMKDDFKVACYVSSWSWLRTGDAKFVPENVIPETCTHILYAYGGLDPQDLTLRTIDKWTDIHNEFYSRINSLKINNPKLVVMLAMGGWGDSMGDSYSRLVSSEKSRSKFATQATEFLIHFGFDGLHLDWQYPVCWQADCSRGPASDKTNYALLTEELKRLFEMKGLVLGVNVAGYTGIADTAFDGVSLAKNADFITVPAYDFHGSWERMTGHTSPLKSSNSNNVDSSMKYWLSKGIPAKKLLMGIPFYGQSFTLAKSADYKEQAAFGVQAKGAGNPGPFTQQAGMLGYYEICMNIGKNSWIQENSLDAPYAYSGNQWVGYDSVASVQRKAEYIKAEGFGGAMIWSLDMDDFNNFCCSETFPLTKTIARVFGIRKDQPTSGGNCERPDPTSATSTTPSTAPSTTPSSTPSTTASTTPSTTASTTPSTTASTTPSTTASTTPSTTTSTTTLPTTTSITTAATPSTPDSVTAVSVCIDGMYFAVPGECNSFYRCVDGALVHTKCSPGLLWNAEENLCDWPQFVTCDSNKVVKSSEAPKPIEFTTFPNPVRGNCKEGEYSQTRGSNCSVYQRCVNGRILDESCPSGLYWNQNLQVCDWPFNVDCPLSNRFIIY